MRDNEDINFDIDYENLLVKNNYYTNQLNKVFSMNNKRFDENPVEDLWDEAEARFKLDCEAINAFISTTKVDIYFKKVYAGVLLGLLVFQLLAVNVIFVLSGFGILAYSDVTFNIFIGGALIEVIVLVTIVVKYLFKDNVTNTIGVVLDKNKKKNN